MDTERSTHQGTTGITDSFVIHFNKLGNHTKEEFSKNPTLIPKGLFLKLPDGTVVIDTREEEQEDETT